jgi:hypothetical protein
LRRPVDRLGAHLFEVVGETIDQSLLLRALTHRSYAYEHGGLPNNERLEFLGDSVLGLVVTDSLFAAHPDHAEGQLAKLRAAVVNMRALAEVGGLDEAVVAHRLMGEWKPTPEFYAQLLGTDTADADISKPYPFFLAYPIEEKAGRETRVVAEDLQNLLGDVGEWQIEWKWDGIRAQVIRRAGETRDDFIPRFHVANANVIVIFQARGVGDFQFLRAFILLVRLRLRERIFDRVAGGAQIVDELQ